MWPDNINGPKSEPILIEFNPIGIVLVADITDSPLITESKLVPSYAIASF